MQDNIPLTPRLITNSVDNCLIEWNLRIKTGYKTEIHSSINQAGPYFLKVTIRPGDISGYVPGEVSQYLKLRTVREADGDFSDFSEVLYVKKALPQFNQAVELPINGSSIHKRTSAAPIGLDNTGEWVDVITFTSLEYYTMFHAMRFTLTGTPVAPVFRILEKTSEMPEYKVKMIDQDLIVGVNVESDFDPKVQTQVGSSLKIQVKCDAGSAAGSSFEISRLEYVEFTFYGF